MATATTEHSQAAGHDSPEEFRKHLKGYWVIFGMLLVLTGVTVGVSYLHLGTGLTIVVALTVATIKGTLVCLYFMHLIDERRLIYWTLLLVGMMAIPLFALPNLTEGENLSHKATSNREKMPGTGAGHEGGAGAGHEGGTEKHEEGGGAEH